jgi:hypothetical protein
MARRENSLDPRRFVLFAEVVGGGEEDASAATAGTFVVVAL